MHTTISGRLGEWIEIGSSRHAALGDDDDVVTHSTLRHSDENRRVVMKVIELAE